MFLGTVIGARLGHCLFYEPEYYLTHPVEIFKIWRGGLASHGGAIGILIALHFFSRKTKLSYLWTLDRVVIATALAAFFIRMGNLMNSEIYGYQTELPWGFIFVRNDEVVPKHPTQIYEALSYLVIFIILRLIYRNAPKGNVLKGSLLGLFLMLVFGARFFIEFVKEVQVEKELAWSMKLGQWLSIPFVITGLLLVLNAFRNKNKPATKK
jgi:prolipoprotein diacylglyceryl transferase